MASCTPVIVVSRSATICEIDTFMTLLSSTITNCATPRMAIGSPSEPPSARPRGCADSLATLMSPASRDRDALALTGTPALHVGEEAVPVDLVVGRTRVVLVVASVMAAVVDLAAAHPD